MKEITASQAIDLLSDPEVYFESCCVPQDSIRSGRHGRVFTVSKHIYFFEADEDIPRWVDVALEEERKEFRSSLLTRR